MVEVKKTLLSLENAVTIERIGHKLSSGEYIDDSDYLDVAEIILYDEGATVTEDVLLKALSKVRELQGVVARLKTD
ncbi:hypothetical protein P5G86_02135 [Paenibacillus jamilae]|uniref:Uncharacterized protein n=1 Tax=Bacillus thuringiensis serovar subtoxicus TaxID=475791 RepID=A0A9X6FGG6_BACTU|nr:hypothetical protein [Bacillus thuringiensis]MEB4838899.1 hypothetical protein [Paenibacillus jamilae]MEB8578817.1 hypothetical protein [Bacillus cereus]MCR6855388.1 hypothetical protein [Bacillus thuringiensis]MDR4283091.1 hypothetical protein [Bacillus thuringiensis]MEB8592229.1 hypothetical protein [Bacillus cereus]